MAKLSTTKSAAAQIQDAGMVVAAVKKHEKALPAQAKTLAAEVAKLKVEAEQANAVQEQLKADLKKAGEAVREKLAALRGKRTRLVRLAEATFGERALELGDFRTVG